MLAAVVPEPGRIEVAEVADPSPRPGEVVVAVEACGICGTDLHIVDGTYHAEYPAIPGHELAGVVVEAPEHAPVEVGARVAINPNLPCRSCRACHRGMPHLCENAQAVGVTRPGGFAELCAAPAELCVPLPEELSLRDAALMEPLSCCLHGLAVLGPRPGDRAAILGGGTIGLLMTQLLRLQGAAPIVISEPDAGKRELALRLGADAAIDPGADDPREAIMNALGGPADFALEAVGIEETAALAIDLAAPGGRVLLFGVCEEDVRVPLQPRRIFREEITIAGSYTNPFTDDRAVALLAGARIDAAAIISEEFPLAEAPAAIERARKPDSLKVMLRPGLRPEIVGCGRGRPQPR
ncbi:MAG: zinc-dependent alcohol dehydrogenase family protein [Armatimonadota bacterium]|nr:zinc-dependent alcohol dehydrogenase family protein [Armatimonadota bacterium]